MPFITLADVALHRTPPSADARMHPAGTVLSDFEVPQLIREKVDRGDHHYVSLLRRLTAKEAFEHRAEKTAREGNRTIDRREVSAPWPDYADLRPEEVAARMREADPAKVAQVKDYERAAPKSRDEILGFDPGQVSAVGPGRKDELAGHGLNPVLHGHIVGTEERLAGVERRMAELEQLLAERP